MRDDQIISHFRSMEGMIASDVRGLQRQLLLLRTRHDALEMMLFGSRFGILRLALLQLIRPSLVALRLKSIHAKTIDRMNEALAKASDHSPSVKKAPVTVAVPK